MASPMASGQSQITVHLFFLIAKVRLEYSVHSAISVFAESFFSFFSKFVKPFGYCLFQQGFAPMVPGGGKYLMIGFPWRLNVQVSIYNSGLNVVTACHVLLDIAKTFSPVYWRIVRRGPGIRELDNVSERRLPYRRLPSKPPIELSHSLLVEEHRSK